VFLLHHEIDRLRFPEPILFAATFAGSLLLV